MPESGVARAVVVSNVDPDGAGRISVRFPSHTDPAAAQWARLVAPRAGEKRGLYFPSEAGDDVLVAFEGGDPRQAYLVGGLWSGDHPPPVAAQADRADVRVLRTRRPYPRLR